MLFLLVVPIGYEAFLCSWPGCRWFLCSRRRNGCFLDLALQACAFRLSFMVSWEEKDEEDGKDGRNGGHMQSRPIERLRAYVILWDISGL